MAEKISLANVSRGAATKYYHAVFVKSIGYCSDLTHISKALWTKIQKPFLRAILPKMGFNRCHPRAALLGPPSHGGLGLTDFWVLQGANQACLFLDHFRQPDTTIGKFLRVTLDWAQFNAGISWPILEFPERPLPHLEGHWIKSIREFAAKNRFHYRLRLEPWAVMLRQGDCPIMDLALMITTNKTTLSRINYCRLYLQVRLVSEVVSASGETMLQAALQGRLEDMPSAPTGVCAVQERPSDRVWGQWRSMWRKISTRKGRLFKPLGRWYPSQICRIRKWNWYYSAQEDTLFRTSGSFFYRHPVITSGGNRYDKNATVREIRLPPDAVPVDRVVNTPSFIVLQPYRRRFLPTPVSTALRQPAPSEQPTRSSPPGRARITAFLRSQATWLNSLHEATRIWQPPSKLRPWFVDDRNMILSVHPHYHGNEADTTGWCLGTEDSLVATGFFRTRCDHNRGRLMLEILGLLQGITAYIGLRDFFGVDRQHALNLRMYTPHKYTTEVCITFARPTLASHKCRAVFEEWPLFHTFEHFRHGIRTHLPEFKRRDKELKPGDPGYGTPRDQAFLSLAWRAARIGSKQSPKLVPLLPKSFGDIVFNRNANVVGNLKKTIIAAAALPPYKAYIERKYDLSEGVFEHIDWHALEVALRRRRDRSVFFHKMIHGWLPLGPRVKYYDSTASPLCPFCNLEDETFHHLLACRNRRVDMWRSNMLHEMIQFFENPGPADQSRYLQQCVQQVLSGVQPPAPTGDQDKFYQIWRGQSVIGWEQLFLGRWSSAWTYASVRLSWRTVGVHRRFTYTWIMFFWKHIEILWAARNALVHGDASNDALRASTIVRLRREYDAVYRLRSKVEPAYGKLFFDTVDQHFDHYSQNPARLDVWLKTRGPLIVASADRQQAKTQSKCSFWKPYHSSASTSRSLPVHTARPPGCRRLVGRRVQQAITMITAQRSRLLPT